MKMLIGDPGNYIRESASGLEKARSDPGDLHVLSSFVGFAQSCVSRSEC
jgi:hypothetical protein